MKWQATSITIPCRAGRFGQGRGQVIGSGHTSLQLFRGIIVRHLWIINLLEGSQGQSFHRANVLQFLPIYDQSSWFVCYDSVRNNRALRKCNFRVLSLRIRIQIRSNLPTYIHYEKCDLLSQIYNTFRFTIWFHKLVSTFNKNTV